MFHRTRTFLEECAATDARAPILDRFGFLLLLVVIALAPFPFGGVLPSGRFRIEIVGFAAAFAAFASGPRRLPPRAAFAPAAFVAGVALLGILQWLPASAAAVGTVSPASGKIYHDAADLLRRFGRPAPAFRISIAPSETAGAVLLVFAEIAIFLAAATLLGNRARRRAFATVFTASAAVEVFVGATLAEPGERVHGAFVNPDHFAGYLEIALAVAFAALWTEVLRGADRARGATETVERLERRLPPLAFRVLVWGVMGTGIALTRSRGGIAAAFVETAAMLIVAVSVSRRRSAVGARAAIIVAVLTGVLFVAGAARREAVARFLSSDPRDIGADMRVEIWRVSVEAAAPFRWLGSGLGSFREAFRLVQPRGMNGLVEEAHSDALQMLVTGGVVGLALAAAAFAAVFIHLARELVRRRHREERALALAGIGALLALVLHGAVDFNLSIPAIPATLAGILGLAFAAGIEPGPIARG